LAQQAGVGRLPQGGPGEQRRSGDVHQAEEEGPPELKGERAELLAAAPAVADAGV